MSSVKIKSATSPITKWIVQVTQSQLTSNRNLNSWELERQHDKNIQLSSGNFIQILPFRPKAFETQEQSVKDPDCAYSVPAITGHFKLDDGRFKMVNALNLVPPKLIPWSHSIYKNEIDMK